MNSINEDWKLQMEELNFKYFVIKANDWFDSLTEEQLLEFNNMLCTYNHFREPKPINSYFLINRDEYNFESNTDFLDFLKERKNENN